MKRKILFNIVLAVTISTVAQLKINELMPSNVSAVWDDAYNFSMWAELYNDSETAMNLNSYYLTDDLIEPMKWQLPNQNIESEGYAVFWLEREEVAGHANFKLDPDGAILYLIDNTGYTVDMIRYPKQRRNISYGRIIDGGSNWGFFIEHSFNASNNTKKSVNDYCSIPTANYKPGFYSATIQLQFEVLADGEEIYYTLDASEPNANSPKFTAGSTIFLAETTIVRAVTLSENKLPSEIFNGTYFISERDFKLPVVSLVTEDAFLYDDMVGIYIVGSNGILGSCPDNVMANYNQDWNRPANFEFFDTNKQNLVNQELDIKISGGCSRSNHELKSLRLTPKKKHGDNEFQFDFFENSKPNRKYNGLLYRNAGNDYWNAMFRDAFMQRLILDRLDMENQAYQPTVCFINGEYRGLQNLRETSNHRNIYSNYNLKEEEIILLDESEIGKDSTYQAMASFARINDIKDDNIYEQVADMIDVDSYIEYMIAEMYFNNGDWPHNNFKMWKPLEGGKWRPILYDTDFGYGWIDLPSATITNVIEFAFKENINMYMFKRLMDNEKFKKMFIDRFMLHVSTTFETNRANQILESLASTIEEEIAYHRERYGKINTFPSDLNIMRDFSTTRPDSMRSMISEFFELEREYYDIKINSNIEKAHYLFNDHKAIDASFTLRYFQNNDVTLKAEPVKAHRFDYWLVYENGLSENDETEVPDTIYSDTYSFTLTKDIACEAVYKSDANYTQEVLPRVYINEVLASKSQIRDEYGNTDDYIELYNDEDKPINIAGWYISDTPIVPKMYQFPTSDESLTTIQPKSYLIVWADGEPEQGVLHTNFSLSKNGEFVMLSRLDKTGELHTVDMVRFPALADEDTYSRYPDGSDNWLVQGTTFNASNRDETALNYDKVPVDIYPTLVKNILHIDNMEGASISVYDLMGMQHYMSTTRSANEIIDLSNLAPGVYIVVVGNKGVKIIKE